MKTQSSDKSNVQGIIQVSKMNRSHTFYFRNKWEGVTMIQPLTFGMSKLSSSPL